MWGEAANATGSSNHSMPSSETPRSLLRSRAETPTTSICQAYPDRVEVRGRDLTGDLMGRLTFTEYFHLLLTGDAVASFVAELPDGSAGIGFASVLSMDPSAGHASLGIVLTPEARDSTWAAAVFLNLADYAFTTFRLRNVYLQVPDFNIDLLSLARAHHLVAEGRMEDYHYHDGRLWGVNFVSFSVDRFTALCGRATTLGFTDVYVRAQGRSFGEASAHRVP